MEDVSHPRRSDRGFTLVELLIVIVILGVLSTVTVFAVSGISSRGESAASGADAHILRTAEEAYHGQNGEYASEAVLVSMGFLVSESTIWDIEIAPDGKSFELVPDAG